MSREAETYELVLALSAFTRRPRSLLDTIAVSIPIVRSFVRSFVSPRARDPLCPGLIYVSTPRTLPTHVGTHQFAARYTSDTGDYRVITRRFDYGLPPRICRLSAGLEGLHPRLDETVASHRGAAPRLRTVYTFVRLRAEGTHLCVYVCVSSDLDIGWDRVACNRE